MGHYRTCQKAPLILPPKICQDACLGPSLPSPLPHTSLLQLIEATPDQSEELDLHAWADQRAHLTCQSWPPAAARRAQLPPRLITVSHIYKPKTSQRHASYPESFVPTWSSGCLHQLHVSLKHFHPSNAHVSNSNLALVQTFIRPQNTLNIN